MNSSIIKSNRKMSGIIAWLVIMVITAFAFFSQYQFELSAPIRAIVWLGWFIISLLMFYLTEQGKQAYIFAKEAKIEMLKVVWPSRTETVQTTMIVMAMVAISGFVLWTIDMGMMWVIGKITHLG